MKNTEQISGNEIQISDPQVADLRNAYRSKIAMAAPIVKIIGDELIGAVKVGKEVVKFMSGVVGEGINTIVEGWHEVKAPYERKSKQVSHPR